MYARRTCSDDPCSFFITPRNVARSSSVRRTIYFLSMGTLAWCLPSSLMGAFEVLIVEIDRAPEADFVTVFILPHATQQSCASLFRWFQEHASQALPVS